MTLEDVKNLSEIAGFLTAIAGGAWRLGRQDREMRQQTRVAYAIARRMGILRNGSVPPPPRGRMDSIELDGEE